MDNAGIEANRWMGYAVGKLNEVLKVYQTRYPECQINEGMVQGVGLLGEAELPPWISNSKYANPLLVAYEARIVELENACKMSSDELKQLKETARGLAKQNETLQKQLEAKMEGLIKRLESPQTVAVLSGANDTVFAGLEGIKEMQQHLELLMQECDLMRDQEQINKQEIVKLTSDLELKSEQVHALSGELESVTEQKNALSEENLSLVAEKTKMQENFEKFRGVLRETEDEREKALTLLSHARKEIKSLECNFSRKQTLHDEKMEKYDAEIRILNANLQSIGIQLTRSKMDNDQLKFKNEAVISDKKTAEIKSAAAKKELETLIITLQDLQLDLTAQSEKVFNLKNSESFLNKELCTMRVERDIYKARESNAKEEISRLDKKLANEVQLIRKEAEDDKARHFEKFKEQEERLKFETRAIVLTSTELEEQRDKLLQDKQSLERTCSKLSFLAKQDQNALTQQITVLMGSIAELKNDRDMSTDRLNRVSADIQQERDCWQKQKDAFDIANTEYRRLLNQKDVHLASFANQVFNLSANLSKAQNEVKHLTAVLNDLQVESGERLSAVIAASNKDIALLQEKLAETEHQLQISGKTVADLSAASKRYEIQAQQELLNMNQVHQKKVADLKEAIAKLSNQNEELRSTVSIAKREKEGLLQSCSEIENRAALLNSEAISMQQRLADSALLLQTAVQREQALQHEARTSSQRLNSLDLEKKRLLRQVEVLQTRAAHFLPNADSIH